MLSNAVALALLGAASAMRLPTPYTRRHCLADGLKALGAAALPVPTVARADDELVDVYFGCGCFWHVQACLASLSRDSAMPPPTRAVARRARQHEFVEAERRILGRGDFEITSYAGYAGGTAGTVNGKVCYHNAANVADYGKLGHAEAVGMRIPASKFGAFAEEYFNLFDKNGFRPDQLGDRGTEYRNVVGLPGGTASPLAKELVMASQRSGDKLDFAKGKGDDADARALTWVYDTKEYPFYIAEAYHQFHDGFAWGEDYPAAYNGLASKKAKAGNFQGTACPNGMLGIGIAGL